MMPDQNWLTNKEVEDVVCKSVLVSQNTNDIINNITKNMKELLEKRGVKLLELPKNKSLEERVGDLESLSAFTGSFYKQLIIAKENILINVLAQCMGKKPEDVVPEDAKKCSLVTKVGIPNQEEFLFEGRHIGTIYSIIDANKHTIKFVPLKEL